jgi:hypothetical protein
MKITEQNQETNVKTEKVIYLRYSSISNNTGDKIGSTKKGWEPCTKKPTYMMVFQWYRQLFDKCFHSVFEIIVNKCETIVNSL